MVKMIAEIGKHSIDVTMDLGRMLFFWLKLLISWPKRLFQWAEIVHQIYYIGVLSLIIIVMSAAFIGMVVSLQGFNTLERFGAETQLGSLVALSVFRELGPVISALLFAGRAGSSVAAEIGLMQVTEQIDSMEMMAVNPMVRVMFPRLVAGIIVLPCLSIIFSYIAMLLKISKKLSF